MSDVLGNAYPQATYEVWLCTPEGERLQALDHFSRLSYVRTLNTIGRFKLSIAADVVLGSRVRKDAMITIWRRRPGAAASLLCAGLVRGIEYIDDGGIDVLTLYGEDGVGLLNRRRVLATGIKSLSDFADDAMKELVRENLGASATDSARDLTSAGLTVVGDLSNAPSIDLVVTWANLLEALRKLAEASREAGTYLYFDMIPQVVTSESIGFQFRTYTGQRGADRTYSGNQPTIFGREWGNLEGARLYWDYSAARNVIYAGGQGDGEDREVAEVEDTTRSGASVWGRYEDFVQARSADGDTALTDAGNAALLAARPALTFTGKLKDTPQTRFGVEWDYGDRVVVEHRGLTYDCMVYSVGIDVDQSGLEDISAQVEVIP